MVEGRPHRVLTDATGYYSIGTLHHLGVEETLTIEKIGYLGQRKHFSSHDQLHELNVVLTLDPAAELNRSNTPQR